MTAALTSATTLEKKQDNSSKTIKNSPSILKGKTILQFKIIILLLIINKVPDKKKTTNTLNIKQENITGAYRVNITI